MSIANGAQAIGLTGPFGSGCTTSAAQIRDQLGFTCSSLSSAIKKEWEAANSGSVPKRGDLQALGNKLRRDAGNPGKIVDLAIQELENDPTEHDKIVFDGIRNRGEVELLRERFGVNFYLVALECEPSERLERLRGTYGFEERGIAAFAEDNERDKDQEDPFGQQVELCVDAADVLVINDETVPLSMLRDRLVELVKAVTGEEPRYPVPMEILMNFAYSAAHGSKCLKRQVGAVLVGAEPGEMGEIVGQGYNENPRSTAPCVDETEYGADPKKNIPGRCYRDIVREQSFRDLNSRGAKCPQCSHDMGDPGEDPPWLCENCGCNLANLFWPERAMTLCTAVHAEVAAVLAAGDRARGTTLYTTTFPCFQCAEKISEAGIKSVVFTEPYPDVRSAQRLELAGIEVQRFEGIRSGRFHEIFSRARPYVSRQRELRKQDS